MDESLKFLKKDPHFAALLKKHGRPTLVRDTGYFQALVRSIIYQQVTGKAAASIMAKFVALFPHNPPAGGFPTPKQVQVKSIEELRSAGLSGQKASYIKDLAQKFTDGTIREKELDSMSTQELTEHLVQVKGIGVWTVHMFLIFTLGRLDVLPVGDLGVQKGFKIVYNMRALPDAKRMEKLAKPWRQHASVVCWYLWRVADEAKISKKDITNKK